MNEWMKDDMGHRKDDPKWIKVANEFLDSDLYTELCERLAFGRDDVEQIVDWYNEKFLHSHYVEAKQLLDEKRVLSLYKGIACDGERVFRTCFSIFVAIDEKRDKSKPRIRVV